ncbi:MAG: enoyl-ACP reductase [Phycisphaerales bacterium]|nr:enoyl-ACP reductase [Phycisphaerales bacterium]
MGLLEGRKGLVVGIANERSIAWSIAKLLVEAGATCAFTHLPGEKMERRARKAIESIGITDPWLMPCNAADDADLDTVFAKLKGDFDTIDFLVHSIAFADREYLQIGNFTQTPRQVFTQALDISAYTLVAMSKRAAEMMPNGGSIIAMTYYGSDKVVPGYNVMGVAKAALEACTRYLAFELGEKGIRVNTISAGPVKTLSAMAVGGIDDMFDHVERKAPLRRNIDGDDVGKTAVYLLSDLSSGVTGENIFVDSGYNTVGL